MATETSNGETSIKQGGDFLWTEEGLADVGGEVPCQGWS